MGYLSGLVNRGKKVLEDELTVASRQFKVIVRLTMDLKNDDQGSFERIIEIDTVTPHKAVEIAISQVQLEYGSRITILQKELIQ